MAEAHAQGTCWLSSHIHCTTALHRTSHNKTCHYCNHRTTITTIKMAFWKEKKHCKKSKFRCKRVFATITCCYPTLANASLVKIYPNGFLLLLQIVTYIYKIHCKLIYHCNHRTTNTIIWTFIANRTLFAIKCTFVAIRVLFATKCTFRYKRVYLLVTKYILVQKSVSIQQINILLLQ